MGVSKPKEEKPSNLYENATFDNIKFTSTHIERNGYKQSKRTAQSWWNKASRHWSGGPQPQGEE